MQKRYDNKGHTINTAYNTDFRILGYTSPNQKANDWPLNLSGNIHKERVAHAFLFHILDKAGKLSTCNSRPQSQPPYFWRYD